MRHLYRIQTLIVLVALTFPFNGQAQYNKGNHNYKAFQDKAYYFPDIWI
jgi:hypothetical protein